MKETEEMKTKKIVAGVAIALAAALMFTGAMFFTACGDDTGNGITRSELSGTVNVTGSTSIQPVMGALADAFMEMYPDVTINISGTGSGQGVTDTQADKNDFGMASRALDAEEIAGGVVSKKIADDGIALVVNTSNTSTTNVTADELYDLYVSDTAIGSVTTAVGREDSSGTRSAFDELVADSDGNALEEATYSSNVVIQNSTGAVMQTVASTSNAIGYISLGSVDDTVKAVSFEGVEPTVANIKNGTYKLARPFNLVLKGTDVESAVADMSAPAQAFYYFIMSPDGQEIIAEDGCISLYL